MARVDDYKMAAGLAAEELKTKDPQAVALASGAELTPRGLKLGFVGGSL